MGGLLSSISGRSRKKKKRRSARRESSSSSSSRSPPPRSRRAHRKKRHHSSSSNSSSTSSPSPYRTKSTRGNVAKQKAKFEQNHHRPNTYHKPDSPATSSRTSQPTKRDPLNVNEFEDYVRHKNEYQPRIVTVELDIPPFTNTSFQLPTKEPNRSKHTLGTMDQKAFEKDCIKAHNEYRRCHDAPEIKRDDKLSKAAQKWAEHLAKTGVLKHSTCKDMGENIANSSGELNGFDACGMWYDEIKDYKFERPGFAGNTGHFTQVVWKGSTHIGVGVAKGIKSPGTFVVANYFPAGNVTNAGQFDDNVKRQRNKPKVPQREKPKLEGGSKPGKTVETVKTEYTEDGVCKRKTVTTTTTVTKTDKGTSTSRDISTKIETIGRENSSVSDRMAKVDLSDSDSGSDSSSSDEEGAMDQKDKRKFRKECLDRHNELRKKHGASRLRRSRRLQRRAQRHARKMLGVKKLSLDDQKKYGVNLAMKQPRPDGASVADLWYSEIKNYSFRNPSRNSGGNFSQLVWKDSTELGVGVASNKDGLTYIAAYYNPPGNTPQLEENVKKAR